MFLRVDCMWRGEKCNDSIYNTHSLCCVCVNVGPPGNGESSLSFLHFYQCNQFNHLINLQSLTHSEQNKLSFKGSFVQQSKINFIPYSYFQHYIYTWQIVLSVCAYICTQRTYTQTYTVSEQLCTSSDKHQFFYHSQNKQNELHF